MRSSFAACFPDSVVGLVAHEGAAVPRYLEFFLRTARRNLERFAPATAQKNINLEILRQVGVPLAPYNEQLQLVKAVEHMHHALAEIVVDVETISELERGLLAKAFAGELLF